MQTVEQEQEQESLRVDKRRRDSLEVALKASSNRGKTFEEVNSIYVHIYVYHMVNTSTHTMSQVGE